MTDELEVGWMGPLGWEVAMMIGSGGVVEPERMDYRGSVCSAGVEGEAGDRERGSDSLCEAKEHVGDESCRAGEKEGEGEGEDEDARGLVGWWDCCMVVRGLGGFHY
ncbi:hypothetical protein AMTR_s00006p00253440 [Amborella trichopoda]|uniref:Uncharacterized protein n=1 Tax=Amborella trichopoda TaxID=13333 RepID=W1PFD3_AMBTC|nr:hypothetical protein AMTR_s00006p00253440 [Amborella trichopoda]